MTLPPEAAPVSATLKSGTDLALEQSNPNQPSGPLEIVTRFVDPLSSGEEWDRVVATHSGAQFFHCAAWARVLARTYGHKPFFLVATKADKTVALFPLMEVRSRVSGARGVSLPFSDFCGPLLFREDGYEAAIGAVLELGRRRGWKHLELRGRGEASILTPGSASYWSHTLDLRRSETELFERCTSSVRRAIRKAEKSGVAIEIESSKCGLQDFYRLHCQTRRRHGLPPQGWTFFDHIHAEVLQAGKGCVIVAKEQGKPIAAAVFFRFGKHALYKFGASHTDASRVRANNLVMWAGIKFWAQSGVEFLHFGRTNLEHDGLRRFKLAWGAIEESLQYSRFDFHAGRWILVEPKLWRFPQGVFRQLPTSLNRIVGAMIYPHLD